MSTSRQSCSLSFTIGQASISKSMFSPRVGIASLTRNGTDKIDIDTPGILVTTSRGVIPHLARDQHKQCSSVRWVHVPFETFLEHKPPIPTLQTGQNPLHRFLGYPADKSVVSMSLRDPHDGREVPPNGNAFVSANSIRGIKRIPPEEWRSYVLTCKPDIVVPLSDTPFTPPPYSQKRLTKSIERSFTWLTHFLQAIEGSHPLNIFVPLTGGGSIAARTAFSESLLETLHGKDADMVKPLKSLDEGVNGYQLDLVPLRLALSGNGPESIGINKIPVPTNPDIKTSDIVPLLRSSLSPLPAHKIRLVNSAVSPHEMLTLIQQIGVDLFDAQWAQRAADIGVALDFTFPVCNRGARWRSNGKRDIGHNLFDHSYAEDFSPLANCFVGEAARSGDVPVCVCGACSPVSPHTRISHSCLDESAPSGGEIGPAFTRAYLHHLLHTHEMSAHSLLVLHNLAVLDAFFAGVRETIRSLDSEALDLEISKFFQEYDEELAIFSESKTMWAEVEMARGKGRLTREEKER
ncbi:tRNA-guanine(15) transglycosylase-like protein [Armillaria luteobubalina]|uniref:tRNA-guanine(15) transglycosylase-like protein n=1 Tax=Armillaria luteobubalina TaxID=153913 RepID=A0AA39V001_9AGAR|nr:tRNA-guanine(15) transglycosylase-like protein [Armillaria luteobubalina]